MSALLTVRVISVATMKTTKKTITPMTNCIGLEKASIEIKAYVKMVVIADRTESCGKTPIHRYSKVLFNKT